MKNPLDAVRTTCRCRLCRMREAIERKVGDEMAVAPNPLPNWDRVACPKCGDRVPVDQLQEHMAACEPRGGV